MSSLTTSCVMEPNKTGEEEDRGNSDCVRNMGQCLDNEIIIQIIKIRLSNDIYIYIYIYFIKLEFLFHCHLSCSFTILLKVTECCSP